MKRQLNDKEKIISSKNILLMCEEMDFTKALIKRDKVTIEIAPIMYKKQLTDLKERVEKQESDLEALQKAIEITEDQVKNGVEEKNND